MLLTIYILGSLIAFLFTFIETKRRYEELKPGQIFLNIFISSFSWLSVIGVTPIIWRNRKKY